MGLRAFRCVEGPDGALASFFSISLPSHSCTLSIPWVAVGEQDAYDLSKFNALSAQVGDGPPGHLHVCELYVSIEIQFRRSWTNEFNGRIRQMELKADKGLPSHQKIEGWF